MSIVINGFDMPQNTSLWLVIKPNGTVYQIKHGGKYGDPKTGTAVPLPEEYEKENTRLKKRIAKLERKIVQMEEEAESNASWERDFRNGQVQGMW